MHPPIFAYSLSFADPKLKLNQEKDVVVVTDGQKHMRRSAIRQSAFKKHYKKNDFLLSYVDDNRH